MKPTYFLPLLPFLALAGSASAQTQAYIDQTSYVTKDSSVYSIDPASTFEVRHGGQFRGRVIYATQNFDTNTGQYIEPELVPIWSVRNSDLGFVGSTEWLGDDANQAPLSPLSFDANTGLGTALLEVPMGQLIGEVTYAPLPHGGTQLTFGFGDAQQMGLNSDGQPIGYDHYAYFSFDTDYPDILTYTEKSEMAEGEAVQITVVMENSTPVDDVLQIDIIGDVELQLIDGGPINSWSLPIAGGTRVYGLDLIARKGGSFFARASLSNGTFADGPWCVVSGDLDVTEFDTLTGPGDDGGGENTTVVVEPPYVPGKLCKPGKCSSKGGDRLKNCTSTFVDSIGTPPNPDCKNGNVGMVIHGKCKPGGETCQDLGKKLFTCPKYKYTVTTNREVGSATVGAKVTVEGEVNFLVGKAKTTGEISGSVESKMSRRCCKYVPVPGETVKVKIKTCQ